MRLVPAVQLVTLTAVVLWLAAGSSDSTDNRVDWAALAQLFVVTAVIGLVWWLGRRARPWERGEVTPGERLVSLVVHRAVGALWVVALVLLVPVVVGELVFDPIG